MREERKVGCLRWNAILMVVAGYVVSGYVAAISSDVARAAEQGTEVTRKVAALVNDQPIYEDQLHAEVEKLLGKLRRYGTRKDNTDLVNRVQAKVLSTAISNLLINQESRKRTIENMDEKVEQRIKDLERKYGAGQGMERYLKIRGITLDDLRESLKGKVRVDEYLKEQGVLEPEIPEDRIREMYEADPDSFSSTEAVRVSHILIAADAHAAEETKDQTRQKAEQIRAEILAGKDFAEMAREHSDCNSASGGGDLGRIKRRYMPEEFEKVAFALEKGALSEVVETKYGYHIIKVVDRHPARVVPYEQMRDFLKKYLQDEESKKRLAAHIADLKNNAKIEILLK